MRNPTNPPSNGYDDFKKDSFDLQRVVEEKDWSETTKVTALSKLRTLESLKFNPEATFKRLMELGYGMYTIRQYFLLGAQINPAFRDFLKKNSRQFKGSYRNKTDKVSRDFFEKFMKQISSSKEMYNLGFLLGRCGLRLSEALYAKWSDFSTNNHILVVVGKGNKQREVPCDKKLLKKNDSITICGDIGLMPSKMIEFRKYLRPYTPHSLRAYFITEAIEKFGLHLHEVQSIVGHSSIEATQRYFRVEVHSAYNKLFGK